MQGPRLAGHLVAIEIDSFKAEDLSELGVDIFHHGGGVDCAQDCGALIIATHTDTHVPWQGAIGGMHVLISGRNLAEVES